MGGGRGKVWDLGRKMLSSLYLGVSITEEKEKI